MSYGIHLEFDMQGESPEVFIAENGGQGPDVIEVLEEPVCTALGGWSWDDEDWEIGPLAKKLLEFLNIIEGPKETTT